MSAVLRSIRSIVPLILLAGATLMLLFIVLSGGTEHRPFNRWYWLEADTSSIAGAPDTTRWTTYNYCDATTGINTDCSHRKAGFPFSPKDNFGTTDGVPSPFVDHRNYYYHTSRAGWAFFYIGLFCTVIALFISSCACFTFLIGIISTIITASALVSTIIAVVLYTVIYVKGRNKFRDDGDHAKLGVKLFAFAWTAIACQLLSLIAGCFGSFFGREKKEQQNEYPYDTYDDPVTGNRGPSSDTDKEGKSSFERESGRHGSRGVSFFRVRKMNEAGEQLEEPQTVAVH